MLTQLQFDRLKTLTADLRTHPNLQGQFALQPTTNRFCCLGRACELSRLTKWKRSATAKYTYFTDTNFLPPEVVEHYGFSDDDGFCLEEISECFIQFDKEANTTLADLNDFGFTFPQIADIIDYWADNQNVTETN